MQLMNKKGQIFDGIASLATGIAVLAITMVVVFLIFSTTKANVTDPNATAALNTLGAAAATIPGWVPIVVVAVIGSLLLGLVALFRRG